MTEFTSRRFPGISIQTQSGYNNSEGFAVSVIEALERIAETRSGSLLLSQIAYARPAVRSSSQSARNQETRAANFHPGVNVVIIPAPTSYMQSGYANVFGQIVPSDHPSHTPANGARFWRRISPNTQPIDVEAAYNHTGTVALIRWSNAALRVGETIPAFILLAHELVHASHYLIGYTFVGIDEENAVSGIHLQGIPGFRMLVNENAIREEAGYPQRISYT